MLDKLILAIIFLISSSSAFATPNQLEINDLSKLFIRGGVYVGEIHGTEESPAFIEYLVNSAIKMKLSKPIIVSLEVPESARHGDSVFWDKRDGRTSIAMWKLIQTLSQLEKENKIVLHFQYLDLWPAGSPEDADEKIALRINEALSKGFVIAYGGNLHNARRYPFDTDKKSARMLIGDKVTSLRLGALESGQAWACAGQPTVCGIIELPKKTGEDIVVNTLYEDTSKFHDYVMYLKKFTASLPYKVK